LDTISKQSYADNLIRQAYLATITDSESEPFEDYRETKIPQPLPIAPSPVPPSDDPYLIVRQAHTPAAIDIESEPEEAPLETGELQPLAAKTTSPPSDHTPTSPDPTLVSPLIDEEFEAYEPSNTRITSSHSTSPSDSTTPLSPDHPLTQTTSPPTLSRPLYYRRTARMVVAYETPTPRVLVCTTWIDPEDSTVYLDIKIDPRSCAPVQTPASPAWLSGSLPISPSSSIVSSPIASPVTTLAATIAVDEDEFLEVGAQLELHESILHDHTHRLGALPPTLFDCYDRDLRELYTRSREVRLIHDLLVQHTTMQRELQELQDRVTTLEQEGSRKGQPNGEALRKCILSGPYKPSTVLVHAVEATDNSPTVAKHTTLETPANMSLENKAYFLAEKEAIHLILTGIGDDVYSTVDACQTSQEMWEAIERLQQ
nr:hypothetical protein [Tanacetum cinerariifolium]